MTIGKCNLKCKICREKVLKQHMLEKKLIVDRCFSKLSWVKITHNAFALRKLLIINLFTSQVCLITILILQKKIPKSFTKKK